MKKIYDTPEMEVFNFETTESVMDSCSAYTSCSADGCSLDCPAENMSCPAECIIYGACVSDINLSSVEQN